MNILYSLQHLGYVIPPQADAGWIGDIEPGPSYLDEGSGGGSRERLHQPQHDLHDVEPHAHGADDPAGRWQMIQRAGGIPAYGNQRSAWDAGERFDFVQPNPEYR